MIYNIRYTDVVPSVVTYPNPAKTDENKNIPSVKKYYPNPNQNVYVSDYLNPNPNVYVYPEINPYYSTVIYPNRVKYDGDYPKPYVSNIIEPSVYEYQNVNKDDNLRNGVVKFFQEKIIKWIETKKEFAKFKSHKNEIMSKNGYDKIYQNIRKFVNHKKYNWYDLREDYEDLREYLANKLEF